MRNKLIAVTDEERQFVAELRASSSGSRGTYARLITIIDKLMLIEAAAECRFREAAEIHDRLVDPPPPVEPAAYRPDMTAWNRAAETHAQHHINRAERNSDGTFKRKIR